MSDLGLKYDTPIATMTIGQLVEVMQASPLKNERKEENNNSAFIYGLDGIARLFGVSKITASKWKQSWLKPACEQLGKTIIVDKEMALQLFKETGRKYNG